MGTGYLLPKTYDEFEAMCFSDQFEREWGIFSSYIPQPDQQFYP